MKLWEFVWLRVVAASILAFAFSVHCVKWPVYWPLRVKGLSSKFAENNLWILSQGCVCCHFILYVCCVRGYCHMHGYCCRFILYPLYCRYYHMRGYYHRFILHDVYCRRCCIHGYCLHFILYAMCRGYCHQFVFYVC